MQVTTLYRTLFFSALGTIMALALLPLSFDGTLLAHDKINHTAAFLLLSWLFFLAFDALLKSERVMLLFCIAEAIEIVQYFDPPRSFSLADLLADALGIALIFAADHLYHALRQNRSLHDLRL